MTTGKLGNINLFVQDVERATRFYTQVLGLAQNDERSQPPHFALLDAGGVTITLQDGATPGAALGKAESIELGFVVDNIDAARERFVQWGAVVSEVQQMGWGGGFDAQDPDGHRLTLYRMRD